MLGEPASSSYAIDWTDHETWSRPPPTKRAERDDAEPISHDTEPQTPNNDGHCADPEAAWGHRRGDAPGQKDETFFGYYPQAATTVNDENAPKVPELVRRIHPSSCDVDPPRAFVPVLKSAVPD